jgi:hypothetical protein
MKTSKAFQIGLVLIVASMISFDSLAQKRNGPPPWAPAHGYHAKARYIYFPEHNFYYDMHNRLYVYSDGPHWHSGHSLPPVYSWINLSYSRQVQLDYYGDRPYYENHYHADRYRHKEHHKAWKKQHKEWEKREREWAKEYDKRHKHCGSRCRDYRYAEERRPEPGRGRVSVDVRF